MLLRKTLRQAGQRHNVTMHALVSNDSAASGTVLCKLSCSLLFNTSKSSMELWHDPDTLAHLAAPWLHHQYHHQYPAQTGPFGSLTAPVLATPALLALQRI